MGKKRSFPAVRSDIPYVQRKQMEKYATIAAHRDEAAAVALQVACVALNDTEGLGYQRLSRFARRLKVLIDEYYAEPEIGAAHLKTRLEQLGFIVKDGRMYAVENAETGEVVPRKMLEVKSNGE
jgi:hypothetical protein